MRRYLLDAGPLTALLQGRAGAVALMRPWVQNREAATSILAYGEAVEYLRPKPTSRPTSRHCTSSWRGYAPFS